MSRAGCHTCEVALADITPIAAEFGVALEVIDVDRALDPEIKVEYGDLVPVVLLDGEQHSCWGVDPDELRADLAAALR